MTRLSQEQFVRAYLRNVDRVYRLWSPTMQEQIAKHGRAWGVGHFDFLEYLRRSAVRFYNAFRSLQSAPAVSTVCDVGGFWGVFPLTLAEAGYTVTMTETLQYVGDAFAGLFDIAFWPKRVGLIFGRSPLPALKQIYESDVPFVGHHHEYSMDELRDLVAAHDLRLVEEYYFGYSERSSWIPRLIRQPVQTIALQVIPAAREVLAVLCQKP